MGLGLGLESPQTCWKQRFRWMMYIPDVCGDPSGGVNILPPSKSARPNVAFTEIRVEHLTETLYYPGKPDYKPIQLTIYDIKRDGMSKHPVFEWLKKVYDAQQGSWSLPVDSGLIKTIDVYLFDGCGTTLEHWVYENAWPQQVDFGDLDMDNSALCTCEITLRYARSYLQS